MISSPETQSGLQHTLKSEIGCSGTGLHTGETVSILLKPAAVNTGIVFRRTDQIGNGAEIRALVENVVEATLCTTLGNEDGINVATVEHLLAALAGCLIDNVIVEVKGSEIPIMDGSAEPFVFLIECAGIVAQDAPRRIIEVLKRVDVEIDGREVSLSPGYGFSVGFEIDFDSDAIGRQDMNVRLVNGTFKGEISRARTFGFAEEVDQLRRMGLALGGTLDNAVVVSGDEILNDEGLRYEDEFVRHKILDCVGDLYLAGAPISGHFQGYRSGHAMNHEIVRALFADPTAWRYTEMPMAVEPLIERAPIAATA
ncbi:MAG: UDP-3-O-[3-hydroxymyristoyl] N-acetylglucosamine deacetylase [Rhodospirillaceae bacterium]|nr:UDP-3-O-[3-hydroxymyristoyl] N-acetylglucosamine deacetylase [Rhodospirillaceae bacterium]|tara:strand:+ start:1084 stop:2019 length:936 start_codon:yes stop_codon:yes gene_type:complete